MTPIFVQERRGVCTSPPKDDFNAHLDERDEIRFKDELIFKWRCENDETFTSEINREGLSPFPHYSSLLIYAAQ